MNHLIPLGCPYLVCAIGIPREVVTGTKLDDEYKSRDDEVREEEIMWLEPTIGVVINKAVEKEDGGGAVECAGEQGEDQPGVPWEGIGELEGGDEYEWPSKRQHKVPRDP